MMKLKRNCICLCFIHTCQSDVQTLSTKIVWKSMSHHIPSLLCLLVIQVVQVFKVVQVVKFVQVVLVVKVVQVVIQVVQVVKVVKVVQVVHVVQVVFQVDLHPVISRGFVLDEGFEK